MPEFSSFKLSAAILAIASFAKVAALATALAILGTASSHAGSLGRPCTAAPKSSWLAIDALKAKIEALGYTVRDGKLKNACGEFYATDRQGVRVELFVDPTDGTIVGKL
jgi:hypothetical protein